jgi:hypothetical protein
MVLIHCDGSDIGIDPCGKLLFHLKFAVYVISKMLPGSMIAYSNILPVKVIPETLCVRYTLDGCLRFVTLSLSPY